MRRLHERENKGFEVQWYDAAGNNAEVQQMDTVDELAQYLARCCWGASGFDHNPTVWKDGKKWCFGEYEPPAKWEERIVEGDLLTRRRFYCSACGEWQTYGKTKFCPRCGARMERPDA